MTRFYNSPADVSDDDWPWAHFTPVEMADSLTGKLLIDPPFMGWLESVRTTFDQPMIITSGYRTPEHQRLLSGRDVGSHVDAQAVDVHVYGESALKLLRVATGMGAWGIGVNQKGPMEKRYIHIDKWEAAPDGTRPTVWTY